MGKVSKCLAARKATQKNKRTYTMYLDPPLAVSEHGDAKASVPNSCTDLGKKRVAVSDFKDNEDRIMVQIGVNDEHPALSSPLRFTNALSMMNDLNKLPKTHCSKGSFHCSTPLMANNIMRTPKTPCTPGSLSSSPSVLASLMRTPKTPCAQSRFRNSPSACSNMLKTPKTPCSQETLCESGLESLPIDMLVKVLCHLHHDQLRPAFHVSKRIREAVLLARQCHFNFKTPDRSRQALLNTITPQPWEHWAFVNNSYPGRHKNSWSKPCPKTPKAARHTSRLFTKFESADVCQIADALFQESAFPSRRASSLPGPISKSPMASNRVLFYSDELNCCSSWL